MANGALDSYLQVQLNVFDIPNILLENGWVDNKIQTINFQNKSIKKNGNFRIVWTILYEVCWQEKLL